MKNTWVAVVVSVALLAGCAKRQEICGVTYLPYGLANREERKNDAIAYEVSWGNVIWGVILVETIIMPIYVFGFALYEPKGLAHGPVGSAPSTRPCAP